MSSSLPLSIATTSLLEEDGHKKNHYMERSEMKENRGRFLKKILSTGQIGCSQKERSVLVNASDAWLDNFKTSSTNPSLQVQPSQEPQHGEEGTTMHSSSIDKENIRPKEFIKVPTQLKQNFEAEASNSSFQAHCTTPSFKLQHKLLLDHNEAHDINELNRKDGQHDLLSKYEKKSPPGGENCIILYTTTIRGVRKAFDDCNKIKFLLRSLRVSFLEKDVSMHLNFRDDLWSIMGGRSIPPRLFIKGKSIGGAEEVIGLHEEGKLKQLLEGIAVDSSGGKCEECGEIRFLICRDCHGRGKLDAGKDSFTRCQSCNENGLVVCSLCCSVGA